MIVTKDAVDPESEIFLQRDQAGLLSAGQRLTVAIEAGGGRDSPPPQPENPIHPETQHTDPRHACRQIHTEVWRADKCYTNNSANLSSQQVRIQEF